MKRMTKVAAGIVLALSVLALPAAAEEPGMTEQPTTVESVLPVSLPPPVEQTPQPVQTAINPGTASSITVAQMGQPRGIVLSGGQLQTGIDFTLPADQVITSAQLTLNLIVSPAMAARNTTMQLMMNGQPLGSVPLGSADSNVTSYQLDIPAALVVSSNYINLKINDADALLCQRDLNDNYQVTIMPDTRLTLEGQQLNIGSDLSHFPRPFFDSMQMTPTTLSFAFPAQTPPWINVANNQTAPYMMTGGLLAVRDLALGDTSQPPHIIPQDDYYSASLKMLVLLAKQ
ncbi:glycosyl hydrolase family 8 [Cedecea davisae]|uniref:glycosyl hydrolase family 8 n=1 Tax=Cedecea davisae TaxID=158484 RepID=UPI00242FED25|nr:glycosyl hydrolase family 8 [Cedecea davisae]